MDAMGNTPPALQELLTEINAPEPVVSDKVILDRDYSVTIDGKLVRPDDPAAHMVLGGRGGLVPRATAEKLGLKHLKAYEPYHPNAEEFARAAGKETQAEELERLRAENAELRKSANVEKPKTSKDAIEKV